MRAALALARRGLGSTWPNPSVGCVIVRDGRVVGRALTEVAGRPHAETQALAMAGAAARGATAYVTLEPCSHHGQTPPCADALAAAGIARVVVACGDPDPRVAGAGLARLRAAGVAVTEGVLREEAEALQQGFLTRIRQGRPMVTLKLATSLDGRIATATGESKWITGPEARRAAHAMRASHDAVLAGIGTVLADDPALTCRIPGRARRPGVRIVLDSGLRTPMTSVLVRTAGAAPVWIVHARDAEAARAEALRTAGVRLIPVSDDRQHMEIGAALQALGTFGLTRVLVEGGAQVATSLFAAGIVDHLAWFEAPMVIGGDGVAALAGLGVEAVDEASRLSRSSSRITGRDRLTEYVRAWDGSGLAS